MKTNWIVSACGFGRNTLAFALQKIEAAGFRRFELWGNVAHFYPMRTTTGEAAAMAADIRRRGFEIPSFLPASAADPFNLASTDRTLREASVSYYAHCIALSDAMDVRCMIVHPGYGLRDGSPERARELAAESLDGLARRARELGVELVLLHTGAVHTGDWDALCALSKRTALGVALDVSLTAEEGGVFRERLQPENRVQLVRFSDGPGGHLEFGGGSLPLRTIFGEIAAAGLAERTVLTLDNRRTILAPEAALERTAAQMKKW